MNHITRQPRDPDPSQPAARATPTVNLPWVPGADQPSAVDGTASRLAWRRLDRLESAATLGIVLASPRSALLVLDRLGSRIPASTARAAQHPDAVTARRRIR